MKLSLFNVNNLQTFCLNILKFKSKCQTTEEKVKKTILMMVTFHNVNKPQTGFYLLTLPQSQPLLSSHVYRHQSSQPISYWPYSPSPSALHCTAQWALKIFLPLPFFLLLLGLKKMKPEHAPRSPMWYDLMPTCPRHPSHLPLITPIGTSLRTLHPVAH